MNPRLRLAIDALLNAVLVIDEDANPAVVQRRYEEALAPALDDMREPDNTNVSYLVSAATSIIHELMGSIVNAQGVTKSDIAEVLRKTYERQSEVSDSDGHGR
ncbi:MULTISPECIES: hypothetical protein [Microbacterium]|uniref:hypothetical protein n=1 Tax=Microbacterium TaxID=33882 RepID=UPI002782433E|nr:MULTISPECIES: hypothetical protein [Microbacterium]MDQ1083884.1 hypothetical protein [Microbacterium sp. SORGH_AS_0344]MDQ1170836.1 hypothetical protein [Microbacterium proteolyticum]